MLLAIPPAPAIRPGPDRVFFADPAATIMPLDEPVVCPVFAGLTFQAIAAAPGPRHYLVIILDRPGVASVIAHLGPDEQAVARTGLTLVAGLRARGDIVDLAAGAAILGWLADCWTVMVDEIAAAADEVR